MVVRHGCRSEHVHNRRGSSTFGPVCPRSRSGVRSAYRSARALARFSVGAATLYVCMRASKTEPEHLPEWGWHTTGIPARPSPTRRRDFGWCSTSGPGHESGRKTRQSLYTPSPPCAGCGYVVHQDHSQWGHSLHPTADKPPIVKSVHETTKSPATTGSPRIGKSQ